MNDFQAGKELIIANLRAIRAAAHGEVKRSAIGRPKSRTLLVKFGWNIYAATTCNLLNDLPKFEDWQCEVLAATAPPPLSDRDAVPGSSPIEIFRKLNTQPWITGSGPGEPDYGQELPETRQKEQQTRAALEVLQITWQYVAARDQHRLSDELTALSLHDRNFEKLVHDYDGFLKAAWLADRLLDEVESASVLTISEAATLTKISYFTIWRASNKPEKLGGIDSKTDNSGKVFLVRASFLKWAEGWETRKKRRMAQQKAASGPARKIRAKTRNFQ